MPKGKKPNKICWFPKFQFSPNYAQVKDTFIMWGGNLLDAKDILAVSYLLC
jgi:hypothetical protein